MPIVKGMEVKIEEYMVNFFLLIMSKRLKHN